MHKSENITFRKPRVVLRKMTSRSTKKLILLSLNILLYIVISWNYITNITIIVFLGLLKPRRRKARLLLNDSLPDPFAELIIMTYYFFSTILFYIFLPQIVSIFLRDMIYYFPTCHLLRTGSFIIVVRSRQLHRSHASHSSHFIKRDLLCSHRIIIQL